MTVFKEFPHTDFVETGENCVALTLRAARGEVAPGLSVFDVDKMLAPEVGGAALKRDRSTVSVGHLRLYGWRHA